MPNFYELEYANRNGLPLFLDVTIPEKATAEAPAPILVSAPTSASLGRRVLFS